MAESRTGMATLTMRSTLALTVCVSCFGFSQVLAEDHVPIKGGAKIVIRHAANYEWLAVSYNGATFMDNKVTGNSLTLVIYHADNLTDKSPFVHGSRFRFRGADHDPWLVMQPGGPGPLYGVPAGAPSTATVFVIEKAKPDSDKTIYFGDQVSIREEKGNGWLSVHSGLVYAYQNPSEATIFTIVDPASVAHPGPNDPGTCVCHCEISTAEGPTWKECDRTYNVCGKAACVKFCAPTFHSDPNIISTAVEYAGGGTNCH